MTYLDLSKMGRLIAEKYPVAKGQWVELQPDGRTKPTFKQERKAVFFQWDRPPWPPVSHQMKRDGLNYQQMNNILNGSQSDNIKLATLYRIAKALGVKPSELLTE